MTGDYLGLVLGRVYREETNFALTLLQTVPEWDSCSDTSAFKSISPAAAASAAAVAAAASATAAAATATAATPAPAATAALAAAPAAAAAAAAPAAAGRRLLLDDAHEHVIQHLFSRDVHALGTAGEWSTGQQLLQLPRRRLSSASTGSLKFMGTETTHPTVAYNAVFAPSAAGAALTYEAWIRPTTVGRCSLNRQPLLKAP